MDGSYPIRITHEGDHQVVHLPRDIVVEPGSVARMEGDKVIIEPHRKAEGLLDLLASWAAEPPLTEEERMPLIAREAPRPFNL